MPHLAHYIAGGAVFLLALDWSGVSFGTRLGATARFGVDLVQSQTIVSREGKGDRLDRMAPALVKTDMHQTVVGKTMAVRDEGASPNPRRATPPAKIQRDTHIPDGCDGAFSPLVPVTTNFTARCVS